MFGFSYKRGGSDKKYPRELKQIQIRGIPMTRLLRNFDFSCFYGYVSITVYMAAIFMNR
jgi:hypothetical protein